MTTDLTAVAGDVLVDRRPVLRLMHGRDDAAKVIKLAVGSPRMNADHVVPISSPEQKARFESLSRPGDC